MTRLLLSSMLLLIVGSCGPYGQIRKQLPTFANLQEISRQLQYKVEAKGFFSQEAGMEIVQALNGGRDEWGHPFVLEVRSQPEFSFVVLSPGKDGMLDVSDVSEYFEMETEDVVGQLDRDIVFRDGQPVTIASSK
jgi:hypothetical protein